MSEDGTYSQSISFQVGPDVRSVHDDAVEAFDESLQSVGQGELLHMMDPTRINAFSSGGPPVWSVAFVPVSNGDLHLTYGFSEAIDPDRAGCNFELSIRASGRRQMWPGLFLRALCRYMLGSGRPLEVGQYMPFPDAITRFFAPPHERANYPETTMNAAMFVPDPDLPRIWTPRGTVEVRRAVGLHVDEQLLVERWSAAGFASTIAGLDLTLSTDIDRPSHAANPQVVAAVDAGSAREGSTYGFVAVPGVGWMHDEENGLQVVFPGGADAVRIHRMIRARLPFGNALLVHDIDPENQLAVSFQPAQELDISADGPVLVIGLPPDHQLVDSFLEAGPQLRWSFK